MHDHPANHPTISPISIQSISSQPNGIQTSIQFIQSTAHSTKSKCLSSPFNTYTFSTSAVLSGGSAADCKRFGHLDFCKHWNVAHWSCARIKMDGAGNGFMTAELYFMWNQNVQFLDSGVFIWSWQSRPDVVGWSLSSFTGHMAAGISCATNSRGPSSAYLDGIECWQSFDVCNVFSNPF